jgi:ribosomal protein S18 acetylase RimI-like enzyme
MLTRPWTGDLDAAVMGFLGGEGRGFCFCTARAVPTWEAWEGRTAEENRALRESMIARGERDGRVLIEGGAVVGWCQVGPRDRLPKLRLQYGLDPDPSAFAVTCFEIDPAHRGKGGARLLLRDVVADLRGRGVRRLEGFPRCGRLEPGEAWTGPEGLFRAAGFREERRAGRGPVMVIDPSDSATPPAESP